MTEVRLLGGNLRKLLGGKSVSVAPGRVSSVLDDLIGHGGEELAALFFEADRETLNRDLRVLVNGRSIAFLSGLQTPIEESDTLTLHLSGMRGFPGG